MTTELTFQTIDRGAGGDSRAPRQRFRLADAGEGPPVVLLHGFPDTPSSWSDTAQVLVANGYRAIVPFLRGYHPDTIVENRSFTPPDVGDDLIALLDTLDIDRAVVAGHDWGASCVWSAVTLAPERFAGVVPIAIPHPSKLKPSPQLAWMARHFINFKLPGGTSRLSRNNFAYLEELYSRWSPAWTGAERDGTVARAKAAFALPGVADQTVEWYRDLELRPERSGAGGTSFPCAALLVAGSEDFGGDMTPYEKSLPLFAEGGTLIVAEGAGHWPHRERADQFHTSLIEFLGSLEPWS